MAPQSNKSNKIIGQYFWSESSSDVLVLFLGVARLYQDQLNTEFYLPTVWAQMKNLFLSVTFDIF